MSNPILLSNVTSLLDDMAKEVKWDCGPEGLKIQCMDSTAINLMAVQMKEPFFEDYMCENPMRLGMNVNVLKKIMKMSSPADRVSISCGTEGDKQNCVTFEFESPAGDHLAEYEMRLYDVDSEELGLHGQQDWEYEVRMPSKQFRDMVNNMKEIGDSLSIVFAPGKMVFKASGDFGDGTQEVRDGKEINISKTKEDDEPMENVYTTRAISLLAKDAVGLSSHVTISAASGRPLLLDYALGEEKCGSVKFFIAPKTEGQ